MRKAWYILFHSHGQRQMLNYNVGHPPVPLRTLLALPLSAVESSHKLHAQIIFWKLTEELLSLTDKICNYFSDACHNKECPFLHIDPETKMRDCPWYDRGFCRHGPLCRNRHVRKVISSTKIWCLLIPKFLRKLQRNYSWMDKPSAYQVHLKAVWPDTEI